MIRIALDAGHGLFTAGKRCMKSIDPNETREWVLNSRDMNKLQKLLEGYENVETQRMDDVTGRIDLSLEDRVVKANNWGAHLYLSNHKNAAIKGGDGGGIVIFRCPGSSAASTAWQEKLYRHLIATTGLKGDRSDPTREEFFYVLRYTKMPALLVEGGFMDSTTDTPIILTEAFSDKLVQGYLNFIVEAFSLKKKVVIVPVEVKKDYVLPEGSFFRVVVGSFGSRNNAEEIQAKLDRAGFSSFLTIYKK